MNDQLGQPADSRSTQDVNLMRLIMEAQHRSIVQARRDQEANASRIARLEEAILLLSVCPEESTRTQSAPPDLPTGHVDLQKFRIADGPSYTGLFHAVEPFLKWLSAVQIFFATKAVTHDSDKIRIVGGLIREINTLAFYSNGIEQFVLQTWPDFKSKLLDFALPTLWRTKLRHQIHKLAMGKLESFLAYSTRERTLQSMVNFDEHSFSDFDLAEFVVSGLPNELKAQANNFELLEKVPIVYGAFKSKLQRFYNNLPKQTGGRARATAQPTSTTQGPTPRLPKDKVIWRIHSFLDSQGSCHHCKSTCGSAPGACSNPVNQGYVDIPASFVTPPKPPNYKTPKAWASSQPTAGKPTQAPAGRPSSQPAAIAGIQEENLFPDLDAASVAAMDEELHLTQAEEYVKTPRIVLLLHCSDRSLRGMVNTGSEINLISDSAVQRLGLDVFPSN
jgi:hypothetical protein